MWAVACSCCKQKVATKWNQLDGLKEMEKGYEDEITWKQFPNCETEIPNREKKT